MDDEKISPKECNQNILWVVWNMLQKRKVTDARLQNAREISRFNLFSTQSRILQLPLNSVGKLCLEGLEKMHLVFSPFGTNFMVNSLSHHSTYPLVMDDLHCH